MATYRKSQRNQLIGRHHKKNAPGSSDTALGGGTATSKVGNYAETVIRNVIESMSEEEIEAATTGLDMTRGGTAWEYVALLDSNTCPTCAFYDGDWARNKEDLPELPMHDNCQCSIIPINFDDIPVSRTAQELDPEGLGGRTKPPPLSEARKGDITRADQAPYTHRLPVIANRTGNLPTYADYLVQTNAYDRAMFFGGGNDGIVRAKRFMDLIQQGNRPKSALRLMMNGGPRNKKFVPA